jgi:hypothetical protein
MGRACPLCPGISDINLFRYCQGVIDLNAGTPDRTFDLGMSVYRGWTGVRRETGKE